MKFDIRSNKAEEFIHHETIEQTLSKARQDAQDPTRVQAVLDKAKTYAGLTPEEAAVLMYVEDDAQLAALYQIANDIKLHIYGRRIVMFAPLYLSDYCVNGCTYCAYHCNSNMPRKKLTKEELIEEINILEELGHKRLAIECGEDPVNCPLDYVLDCIDTIYSTKLKNGEIRRVNVNIAATTVEDYKRLKAAGIGTYILFQETYHKETYERVHPTGPKHNYEYHTTAHDRAMQAGIDDVGVGVLYGLYDWHYDLLASLFYAAHLEAVYGVGPHTFSVPRIRAAEGVDNSALPYAVSDPDFKKIVAILRLACPYTGIIISTREEPTFRDEILSLGVSQISYGSCTGVGGYAAEKYHLQNAQNPQFKISDDRSGVEILKKLMRDGFVPSFCTACYREGRTGDRFMRLAKTGQIGNVCQPNSLITLKEYSEDYGDPEFKEMANRLIAKEVQTIPNEKVREKTTEYLAKIEAGERDFRF